MSGRNLEDFFQEPEAFEALSDEDRARLFAGETIEGETKAGDPAEDNSGAPAAGAVTEESAAATEPTATDPKTEPEPTVLAKDGKHTIPFSELEAARERARQLEHELLALKATPPEKAVEGEPTKTEPEQAGETNEDKLLRIRREEREAMFQGDTELAEKLGREADALNRQIAKEEFRAETASQDAERKAKEAQESADRDIQSRASALIEKYPFLDHTDSAKANLKAINLVRAERFRLESEGVPAAEAMERAVAEVAPLYDKGTTKQDNADVARKAAEALAKAKAPIPNSLSEAPAGTKPHHDEAEALRAMDTQRLALSLESKSPEEIMRIMAKAL